MDYISKNIKYLMELKNIKQTTLEKAVGLNRGNIGSYLKGHNPKMKTLQKISEYFKINADDLINKDLSLTGIKTEITDKKPSDEFMEISKRLTMIEQRLFRLEDCFEYFKDKTKKEEAG